MIVDKVYNYLSRNGIDVSQPQGSIIQNPREYPSHYWGLKEKDTREFIALCNEEQVPIIGIDIFVKENGSYYLSWDAWYYERKGNESFTSYLRNSINGAIQYLGHFTHRDDILFSFTTLDHTDLYEMFPDFMPHIPAVEKLES